ncbi:MAG: hypothetical protein QM817_35515 [Archangium sp.]
MRASLRGNELAVTHSFVRISSAWSSGVEGISRATATLDTAAAETYDATVPTDSVSISGGDPLITATTDRMQASLMMQANVKLLQSAQQMDDTLLSLLVR